MLLVKLGYDFLLEGYLPHLAPLLAKKVAANQGIRFNPLTFAAELGIIELGDSPDPVRLVLGRTESTKGQAFQYFSLVTTIPERLLKLSLKRERMFSTSNPFGCPTSSEFSLP